MPLLPFLVSEIRARGPLTVARFMELALYHPEWGYYAGAAQRSGRRGDFFTSVDVGPLFGQLIAAQLAEMWGILRASGAAAFDLVEAGAGNGRLARDVLDAAAAEHPDLYRAVRLTLVERSEAARRAQAEILAPHAAHVAATGEALPAGVRGVIVANELLDAMPVHVVTRTDDGLREIAVGERDGVLHETLVPVSSEAVLDHLREAGAPVAAGARVEVGLAAGSWMREAAAALDEGFLLVFDYGGDYGGDYGEGGPSPEGTLVSYRGHTARSGRWLEDPGGQDLTADVDLGSLRRAAEAGGLTTLGILDQTYFLLSLGLADRVETGHDRRAIGQRLAARMLIMPGGLGSTMKAMVFAKNVGTPRLGGTASGRLT